MNRVAAVVLLLACAAACSRDEPPTPAPPPPASASASAPAPASALASASAPASAPTCGDSPLPLCPLGKWMKANTAPAVRASDFAALDAALQKVATFAPPGYPNWASIARDGADAARAQTLDGVKAACRGCHNQYRDRYKQEMRDRPI